MFSWFKRKTAPPTPSSPSASIPKDATARLEEFEKDVRQFWKVHPVERSERRPYLLTTLRRAIDSRDETLIELVLEVALRSDEPDKVTCLGEMLLVREHYRHQELVRELQLMADPKAVTYLIKALNTNLEHMVNYNGSGSGVVAKWFSHALLDIGSVEAIEALKAFSNHADPEVRDEMLYRLGKLAE